MIGFEILVIWGRRRMIHASATPDRAIFCTSYPEVANTLTRLTHVSEPSALGQSTTVLWAQGQS